MNRRSLVAALLAAPAALLVSFRSFSAPLVGSLEKVHPPEPWPPPPDGAAPKGVPLLTNEQLRGEPCFPGPNPYRSGMRLRLVGPPPESGRLAAHSVSLTPGCIRDADTGEAVTDISSMVVFVSAFGWMDAIVTVTLRDAHGRVRRDEGGGLLRTRHASPVSLDLTVRSESVVDHADRLRLMGDALKAADHLVSLARDDGHDELTVDQRSAVAYYRDARRALDDVGGAA